jgi:hypothetical protein
MRNRKDTRQLSYQLVPDGVWKMLEVVAPKSVFIFGPILCGGGQPIDCVKQFRAEGVCDDRASFEVPLKSLAGFCLRFGQYLDVERTQREPRRCRTSAQGAACTRPERNSARRRIISARHCSEIVASSAVSRLSRSATAKAERSSTGRPSTSSKRWSTRAFMSVSLAPQVVRRKGSMDNMSIDTDTHQLRLRRAAVCRSSSR